MKDIFDELEVCRCDVCLGGGQCCIDVQYVCGKLIVCEWLELLLDEGLFEEFDMFVCYCLIDFGIEVDCFYGDGVVIGWGMINGCMVYVFLQDFMVFGGLLLEIYVQKICKIMDMVL